MLVSVDAAVKNDFALDALTLDPPSMDLALVSRVKSDIESRITEAYQAPLQLLETIRDFVDLVSKYAGRREFAEQCLQSLPATDDLRETVQQLRALREYIIDTYVWLFILILRR